MGGLGVLRLPSADKLDAFVESIVEVIPDDHRRDTSCESLGRMWRSRGVRPGDLVLLCLPNSADLLNQFFGVLAAGAVPALLPTMMPTSRLRDIASAMRARVLVGRRPPAGDIGEESRDTEGHLHVTTFRPPAEPAAAAGEVVLLTSGTSGFASGCVFDLNAVLLNASRHADAIGQHADDVVLVILPLYLSYALAAQALAALVCGSRLVVGGPPFALESYRAAVRNHGVTVSSLTPVLVRSMLSSSPSVLDEPRVVTVGGDALDSAQVARLVDVRRGRDLYLTYGLTQAGPRVSTLAAHREPRSRFGSVSCLPGTQVSFGPPGGDGLTELYVTSDTVMKRSIGRIEGRVVSDPSGRTIATGDAFERDADRYLHFRGRLSDFISRRGDKISLAAVRRVVSQLPHVIGARTTVFRDDHGDDFDLELHVDADGDDGTDVRRLLRRVLGHAEMPRHVRVHVRALEELPYK